MHQPDRRIDPRLPRSCPVKLRCDSGGFKYLSGQTENLSAGGALIKLDVPQMLLPGQRVELGIAETPHQGLLSADCLASGTVVRSLRHAGVQHIAIRFDQKRQQLAQAG